jgi:hypothetical protein|nr:hypothetical protein [Kofleriaceae bacterium]
MSLVTLALAYAGIGAGVATVLALARRATTGADVVLAWLLWPLYGPLLVAGRGDGAADDDERRLLAALPDRSAAGALALRLRDARARLAELDDLLGRPDFDPTAAESRAGELAASGATAAAAAAQMRVRTLGRLHELRGRYRRELAEVGELVAQLAAQLELVRLEPGAATASGELVHELIARVEALGVVLE